jgi:predicted O-linked N-acetylglucosamine transferase (SPINDLY family)
MDLNLKQEEQEMINYLYSKLNTGEFLTQKVINKIKTKWKKSVFLQYYLGYYYELEKKFDLAQKQYKLCMVLDSSFSKPYMHVISHLLKQQNKMVLDEVYRLAMTILCKKTLDPMVPGNKKRIDYIENLQLCNMVRAPFFLYKKYRYIEIMYKKMLNTLDAIPESEIKCVHIECYKHICKDLGEAFLIIEPEQSNKYYKKGIENKFSEFVQLDIEQKGRLEELDKQLLQSYYLSLNYSKEYVESFAEKGLQWQIEQYSSDNQTTPRANVHVDEKIRIGYISSDFNKNAVGLFLKPLLQNYDKTKFEVYCYYNNTAEDEFTFLFKQNVNWNCVGNMTDNELYSLIKNKHRIHILVDLISLGVGGRKEVIQKSPAPVVINYLGFPDSSRSASVGYRITDRIADPDEKVWQGCYPEHLLFMPRCFVCWNLHDNVNVPKITSNETISTKTINIGIFNRDAKHHPFIREAWKDILKMNKNIILHIKLGYGETHDTTSIKYLYSDFPQSQIKIMPFTKTLEEYFELFNSIDFCLDTFPYSGTTTTCSSLFMGVPVITLYKESNHHVANVSASILENCGLGEYVCSTIDEYKDKAMQLCRKDFDLTFRQLIRSKFLNCMDPKKFISEYETLIESLVERCSEPLEHFFERETEKEENMESLTLSKIFTNVKCI